jgi:SAM-dependent methyltransferase
MDMSQNVASNPVHPQRQLLEMITGYWVTQSLYVVAKLGIPDLVDAGPKPVVELAAQVKVQPELLRRVLRALASIGVFSEVAPGTYASTPLSALLRSGTLDSMRSQAIMHGEEQYVAWADVLHAVRTGEIAFERRFNASYFGYLAQHAEADRVFNDAQAGYTKTAAGAVVDTYDFSAFKTVVDIGAGYGPMLIEILRKHPRLRGILFDQPHVAEAARERLVAAGVADRCATVGGDFFAEVPQGGDAYIMSLLLHDWNDERTCAILQQCRRAIPQHGKLLIVELVPPAGQEPFFGKWLDLHMMVLLGAAERTRAEFESLLKQTGFQLKRVIPTQSGLSIVEAEPV